LNDDEQTERRLIRHFDIHNNFKGQLSDVNANQYEPLTSLFKATDQDERKKAHMDEDAQPTFHHHPDTVKNVFHALGEGSITPRPVPTRLLVGCSLTYDSYSNNASFFPHEDRPLLIPTPR
jgi:hypothetical protein